MPNDKFVLYGPWFMYPRPIPIPGVPPTDTPVFSLDVSEAWVPIIIGALKVLLYDGTWDSTDIGALSEVSRQVDELLSSWYPKEVAVGLPVGTVISYAGTSTPAKFLHCQGQEVSRVTYADLFAAIGTTWGIGDGSTTFNIPDTRGLFWRGDDPNQPINPGEIGGAEFYAIQIANLPAHHHREIANKGSAPYYEELNRNDVAGNSTFNTVQYSTVTAHSATPLNTGDTGSNQNMDILPPYNVIRYLIYAGV